MALYYSGSISIHRSVGPLSDSGLSTLLVVSPVFGRLLHTCGWSSVDTFFSTSLVFSFTGHFGLILTLRLSGAMTDVADHPGENFARRRQSILPRDGDGMTLGPNIRRMSRMDAPRASVQYGMSGRRMSHVSRSSISGASFLLKDFKVPVQYQNTYRIAPNASEKFQPSKAQRVMREVLESYLSAERYSTDICGNIVQQISDVIKGRVKDLGFSPRYKFVCVVTIGQNRQQGVAVASRSVWNPETDNFATASYKSGDLFAVANIFATYFE
ncbi:dynein light chain Tctex-type 5-like [Physella acuta]|uniref:dynein light chain Tctex-type 5-like n=1 Tax=Physella acuta TaxID=109671 RepID=UPI0027DB31F6|nr:dynein light chain Tctex-type 5-like [Physella acuta]